MKCSPKTSTHIYMQNRYRNLRSEKIEWNKNPHQMMTFTAIWYGHNDDSLTEFAFGRFSKRRSFGYFWSNQNFSWNVYVRCDLLLLSLSTFVFAILFLVCCLRHARCNFQMRVRKLFTINMEIILKMWQVTHRFIFISFVKTNEQERKPTTTKWAAVHQVGQITISLETINLNITVTYIFINCPHHNDSKHLSRWPFSIIWWFTAF